MSAPLVAIPAYRVKPGRIQGWKRGAFAVPETYAECAWSAGLRPVVLTHPDGSAAEILDRVDCLLLIGGGDVDPARYGGEPHPHQYGVDAKRDAFEIDLVRAAVGMGVPTLGVCRGPQIVNVAFGGTLLQHLPEVKGLGEHGVPRGGEHALHEVKVSPGTRLAQACGQETLTCLSHHHQGLDRLGEELVPAAWAPDGLVEAVEREDAWLVAVQWHPEETAHEDPTQQALFEALAEQAEHARRGVSKGAVWGRKP